MSLYAMFRTDDAMEKQGIELDYGTGGKIRIARAGGGNSRFSKILADKLKPYRRQIDTGTLDDGVATKIMAECYADAVILGWSGVTGPDGEPLAFNKANCVQLLTDLPELFRDIQEQAGKLANFRAADLDDDAKN